MGDKVEITRNTNFYKDFRESNPALILGLIIISFGFFIINWIYVKNKEFEEIDMQAPDSNRGAILMMVLPFGWFFSMFVFKNLLFSNENLYIGILEIVGWGVIAFLIMKYLFDFCMSFGKITRTNGLYWFLFFIISFIGVVFAIFGFYLFLILEFFLIIVIPAMQAELNSYIRKFHMKKESNLFYN